METIRCSYKDPPWITQEIKSALRKKNRLHKKYISHGMRLEDQTTLNNFSYYCSELITSSKSSYYSNLGSKLNNPMTGPKAYWSYF